MKRAGMKLAQLLPGARTDVRGHISGLPLADDVEILKDGYGIPHIFAKNEDDLFTAQGFMHAQDRLWQMEILRRLPRGRLSEVAKQPTIELDHFFLLTGLDRLRRRAMSALTPTERHSFECYVGGINAFIHWAGKNLPIEFRSLKITPAEWRVEDLCGVLAFTAWSLQMNYEQELVALLARDRLDADLFNELYPVEAGAELPRESFFECFRGVKIAPLEPAALAFSPELARRAAAAGSPQPEPAFGSAGPGMSNCWVVADGEGSSPILANDPHLGAMVPQVWHACHLSCPTLNVVGVSMLGFPGIVLGRNERVAWGATNVAIDMVDLYILRVDPKEPTRYFIGDEAREMTREVHLIPTGGGEVREIVVYRTIHGTVLSRLEKGYDAVVVLKWYGTLADDAFEDSTLSCFLSLLRAKSVEEALEIGELMKSTGLNLTVADLDGNIGWQATGLVPIRSGYSGRAPADGSDPAVGWKGFVPYDQMPSLVNPEAGRIATANNRTVPTDYPHHITYSWLDPCRHDRTISLLEQIDHHTIASNASIQMDVHSLHAERILPGLFTLEEAIDDPQARRAITLLKGWDREMSSDSTGATVFAVFITELETLLAEPLMGEHLPLFLFGAGFFYSPGDALLSEGGGNDLLRSAGFDGAGDGAAAAACEEALRRAISLLSDTFGSENRAWQWGRLHTHLYEHPGAGTRLTSWLLNRGPYPAPGDMTTINVSGYDPTDSRDVASKYRVVTVPSMRFITSMSDPDSSVINAPMGQSGKPGNRHYDDMIKPWLAGRQVPLPLTRDGAERIAKERFTLGT